MGCLGRNELQKLKKVSTLIIPDFEIVKD
jgi:hypothetical protein